MNPRIQELIKQCRWQEIVVEDGEEWIHAHFDEHKFAELIVRECMEQCAYTPDSGEDWDKGVKWAYNQIKQHFGVEE